MNFNNRKPKPEHLETLIELLKKESDLTPIQVTVGTPHVMGVQARNVLARLSQ